MKLVPRLVATLALFVPSVALACPYASAAAAAGDSCGGSSLAGYGASLFIGLGVGFASVLFERRRAG
jgi:hypothetical protein